MFQLKHLEQLQLKASLVLFGDCTFLAYYFKVPRRGNVAARSYWEDLARRLVQAVGLTW